MSFNTFVKRYGKGDTGAASALRRLGLADNATLAEFCSSVGSGLFADGFLTVASEREAAGLGAWGSLVPARAQWFATTGFGTLFVLVGDSVWVADTQYGAVVEATAPLAEFIDSLADPEVADEQLRYPLFADWNGRVGPLAEKAVLSPRPALALGGEWRVDTFGPMPIDIYLDFTANFFSNVGENAIITERAERVRDLP